MQPLIHIRPQPWRAPGVDFSPMRTSRFALAVMALAVACFAAVAAINAQSRDKAATVTLTIEGMT